jgi:hypothetical protein
MSFCQIFGSRTQFTSQIFFSRKLEMNKPRKCHNFVAFPVQAGSIIIYNFSTVLNIYEILLL